MKTILRGLVGSTIHGLSVQDGVEDRDEMGVCIEPIERAMCFHRFEQHIYRTAEEREGRHNAPSKSGDLDLVVYSLRKYTRLILGGNPTMMLLLFIPDSECIEITDEGRQLRQFKGSIVSKRTGKAYLGYMQQQRKRLNGELGGRHGSRPELIGKYGYDIKYATHILRLGHQGIELMRTGTLALPIEEKARQFMLEVRRGAVAYEPMIRKAIELERELTELVGTSTLPEESRAEEIEAWMIAKYRDAWRQ